MKDALEKWTSGVNLKWIKPCLADANCNISGAIFGTSNTTTFGESAAGIGAGRSNGFFFFSLFLKPKKKKKGAVVGSKFFIPII